MTILRPALVPRMKMCRYSKQKNYPTSTCIPHIGFAKSATMADVASKGHPSANITIKGDLTRFAVDFITSPGSGEDGVAKSVNNRIRSSIVALLYRRFHV